MFAVAKPVFKLPFIPYGIFSVPVCSKSTWDTLIFAAASKDKRLAADAARKLCGDLPGEISGTAALKFICSYREKIEDWCKENVDIYGFPEHFGEDEKERCKLDILTLPEHMVCEYAHMSLDEAEKLDILDFRMLLADAAKLSILRRSDGKGVEYLNECYNFMHKISDIFDGGF